MKATATICIERDGDELELTVEGRVSPRVAARLWGGADNWAPAEGGEAEVCAVLLGGKAWDGELSADEEREAEAALWLEAADDDSGSDYEDRDYFDDHDVSGDF